MIEQEQAFHGGRRSSGSENMRTRKKISLDSLHLLTFVKFEENKTYLCHMNQLRMSCIDVHVRPLIARHTFHLFYGHQHSKAVFRRVLLF